MSYPLDQEANERKRRVSLTDPFKSMSPGNEGHLLGSTS